MADPWTKNGNNQAPGNRLKKLTKGIKMNDFGCFLTHLECSKTGAEAPADRLQGTSEANAPYLVRYDLDAVGKVLTPDTLAARPRDMWRYRELLPYPDAGRVISLGEPWTPLVSIPATAKTFGGGEALVKDEGRLPTGSFKARGLAMAVTMAHVFGVKKIAMPSAGNAGAALAAYGARAGIKTWVFVPADAPEATVEEAALHGAEVHRVDGLIDACGREVAARTAEMGWFDFSTLKEPYRIEGKKTMGLELAEQLGWTLPDAIFYPTGGGTGLIGMWKAFQELKFLGWLTGKMPKMVAVQSTGCGPVVKAFEQGDREVKEPWGEVDTEVHGVRVRKAFGDRLIMDAIYESDGFAVAVSDDEVDDMRALAARADGVHLCPEGAACLAAYAQAIKSGRTGPNERVVIFNSASGLKSPMPKVD
jgi:threonine synthase